MAKKEMTATEATATNTFDIHAAKVGILDESAKDFMENPLNSLRNRLEADADAAEKAGLEARNTWKEYIFDFSDRSVTKPDFLLNMNGVDMFPRSSLTCITGKAGQGKSQLVYLMAAAISSQRRTLGITTLRPATINIVDTEQEAWSISDKANRMLRLMGKPNFSPAPDGMSLLTLRQVSSNKERLKITMDAIEELKPEVVFIDGITDMVEHIEDPDEAQRIVADLLKLIDEKGITLFVVIHQNEGSDNAKLRAFIGSELMRKAFCILEVSAKDGAFEVKNTKTRSIPMPMYKFRINEMGDLTDSMVSSVQTEEGRLRELMEQVVEKRHGAKFDSKKQIYTIIASLKMCSQNQGKNYLDKAEALGIVSVTIHGHKYKLIVCDNSPLQSQGENDEEQTILG
jgi:archaellum biogenesis ATPase FlaH